MPFGVQPIVTLAYHWYHWLSTSFTICSKFCRRSRAWVKRFTRENYVIKMEDLKNLAADTSGITTILPIQMTINNKITNVWLQGSRWNIFQTASCYVILVFHFNPRCGDRIWTSKLVIGLNRVWAFRGGSELYCDTRKIIFEAVISLLWPFHFYRQNICKIVRERAVTGWSVVQNFWFWY